MTIKTIEEGKMRLEEIRQERAELMAKMRETTGAEWQTLCDQDYDLKREMKDIQHGMLKIAKAKRAAQNGVNA